MSKTKTKRGPRPEWNLNPSFSQWLYTLAADESELGVFARWIFADTYTEGQDEVPCWPHRGNTLSHMIVHLRTYHSGEKGAPDELLLRRVYEAYQRFLAADGKVPLRRGGIEASGRNAHRGYLLPKTAIEQIKDLSAHRGVTQGEVIAREIGRAYAASGLGK